MADIQISSDQIYERYGDALNRLSYHDGKRAFARALNYGGDRARTQVKRSLAKQTGIKYGLVNKAVTTDRANAGNLAYSLIAVGGETNLNLFGAKQRKKGVSAAPWKKRRIFRSTFIVDEYGGKVYKRQGQARGPLEPLWGPNIARELVRPPTVIYWDRAGYIMLYRVEHEIMFLLSRVK